MNRCKNCNNEIEILINSGTITKGLKRTHLYTRTKIENISNIKCYFCGKELCPHCSFYYSDLPAIFPFCDECSERANKLFDFAKRYFKGFKEIKPTTKEEKDLLKKTKAKLKKLKSKENIKEIDKTNSFKLIEKKEETTFDESVFRPEIVSSHAISVDGGIPPLDEEVFRPKIVSSIGVSIDDGATSFDESIVIPFHGSDDY